MFPAPLRTALARWLAAYNRWAAESDGQVTDGVRLLDNARVRLDDARAMRADPLPRRGERVPSRDDAGAQGKAFVRGRRSA